MLSFSPHINTTTMCYVALTGPYAWLYGLYHMHMPQVTLMNQNGKDMLDPYKMVIPRGNIYDYNGIIFIYYPQVIHAMKHGRTIDNCNNITNWVGNTKYQQDLVIGKLILMYFVL